MDSRSEPEGTLCILSAARFWRISSNWNRKTELSEIWERDDEEEDARMGEITRDQITVRLPRECASMARRAARSIREGEGGWLFWFPSQAIAALSGFLAPFLK